MTEVRISVVVPTLDTKELTLECVDAVLESRLPEGAGLEVVVVDDGGRDGTAEALEGRSRVRVLRNTSPTGFSKAVNRGVRETRGDILVILNSDAVIERTSLAHVLDAFAADPSLGIAGAALSYPDGTAQWSAGPTPGLAWLFGQSSGLPALLGRIPGWRVVRPLHGARPRDVAWVSGASMAVRVRLWDEAGPFDEGYDFYVQDLDLCLRARARGWRVRLLPAFRVVHHRGATIAASGGSVAGNADLGLLWADLVRWAETRGGASSGRRARWTLLAGSALRLLARRLATPFVAADRREAWRSETTTVVRARARLRARTA